MLELHLEKRHQCFTLIHLLQPILEMAHRNVSRGTKTYFWIFTLMINCEEFFPKYSLRNKDYESTSLMNENHSSELIELFRI